MGCTLMGGTLLSMIASFPRVQERTRHWDEEVKKSNYFLEQFQRIQGSRVLSEWPRKHTLTKVDTTGSFDTVAKTHKRRGFFFSDELKEQGNHRRVRRSHTHLEAEHLRPQPGIR